MTEVLLPSNPENHYETRPGASEIFASAEELEEAARKAVEHGTISTRLHTETDESSADITIYHALEADDLSDGYVNQENQRYISGSLDEMPVKDEEKIIQRVAHETEEKLVERVFHDTNWHLGEPLLESEIEANTPLNQRFELIMGEEKPIEVLNFTETELSPSQQELVRRVVSQVAGVSGTSVFKATNAIAFEKADRFKGKTVGTARGATGVIVLNENLINGAVDFEKFTDLEITPLEAVLTHELAHLIELQDSVSNAYGEATGWREETKNFVDDYGTVEQRFVQILETPWEITLTDDGGDKQAVIARDQYELKDVLEARPVTNYGHSNKREDLAEAFVPYVHARGDKNQLDVLRRDALDGMMRRVQNEEHGPHLVTMSSVPLARKIGLDIKPTTYMVGEPRFSYTPPAPEFKRTPLTLEEQQKLAYAHKMADVVDDYGNTVQAARRSPSRW